MKLFGSIAALLVTLCLFQIISYAQLNSKFPLSDNSNQAGWKFNSSLSDEFNGKFLDSKKWTNQHTYWDGRTPSRFDASNVSLADGKALLKTTSFNLVRNHSFETGDLNRWLSWGTGTKFVTTTKHRGKYGVMMVDEGGLEQVVTGLLPNTKYKLSGYIKLGTSFAGKIGVKDYGGKELATVINESDDKFHLANVIFTTGSTQTSAKIYLYNSTGSGSLYGDEITLVPLKISSGLVLTKDYYATAGVIQSKVKVPYGYYEIRAKVADATHTSSFWFQGSHSEIDVFEAIGNSKIYPLFKHYLPTNTHYFPNGWKNKVISDGLVIDLKPVNLPSNYHVFGLEWDSKSIKWYFDGKLVRTKKNENHHENLYLFLDTEIFEWQGIPDNNLNSVFAVDYIRAWHK